MFSVLSLATVALAAVASVDAAVVPRTTKPDTYYEGYLEKYEVYHTRYLALGCQLQHGKPFFDDCCHPMLATETLEKNRKPYCVPSAAASSSAHAAEPTSTVTTPVDPSDEDCDEEDDDDAEEDCDDEDDNETAPAPQTAPTPAPAPAPATTPAPAPSSSKAVAAQVTPATKPAAKPETQAEEKPTSTKHSTSKAPQSTGKSVVDGVIDSVGQLFTGGVATFFFQNGVPGACGTVHSDNDMIAAIDSRRYGNTGERSQLCGKKVNIINENNGKSVQVTIADACPTCNNENSIDLSHGAFLKIATEAQGMVGIKWSFVD